MHKQSLCGSDEVAGVYVFLGKFSHKLHTRKSL